MIKNLMIAMFSVVLVNFSLGISEIQAQTLPEVSISVRSDPAKDNITTEKWHGLAYWTVTRTGSVKNPLMVHYTVGGTATSGKDYEALSGTVAIPAGSSSADMTTRAIGDSDVEEDESITVTLTPDAKYLIGISNQATCYIVDDRAHTAEVNMVNQSDGKRDDRTTEENQGLAYWMISRSGDQSLPLTVLYDVSGTATRDVDYTGLSGSVVIPAGSGGTYITARALKDSLAEPDETMVVTLAKSAMYVVGSANTATGYVIDQPVVVVPKPTAPNAPTGLTLSVASATQINLSWSDNADNETAYIVQRKTSGGVFTQIAKLGMNVMSYNDAGLMSGTTYEYRVRSLNEVGSSAYSNIASATTPALAVAPTAPTGLTLTVVSTSQINLAWNDNADNETGFKIERKISGKTYSQIATVGANVKAYHDTGLSANTTYVYRIRATNAVGNSAYSNTASATTMNPPPPPTAPLAPSSLTLKVISEKQMNLAWRDGSNNETGFKIERKISGKTYSQIATVGANVTTYNDDTLSPTTTYVYRVRATNAVGNSAYSNTASATTDAKPVVDDTPLPPTKGKPPIATLAKNPFNKWSAHHRPIGANAEAGVPGGTSDPRGKNPKYSAPGLLNSRGRLDVVGAFYVGNEEKTVLDVTPNDPFKIITKNKGGNGKGLPTPSPGLRFPKAMNLPSGGDAIVGLYPHNGLNADLFDVFFQFRYPAYSASYRVSYPLAGTDVWEDRKSPRSPGATAIRIPSGVLRGFEINSNKPEPIDHALNATATRHCSKGAPASLHVLGRTMVWPAYSIDAFHITDKQNPAKADNQGDIPYGTVIFIRPQDYGLRNKLANDRQKAMFDVLCYYGCRLVDGQGQTTGPKTNPKAVLQLRTDGELSKEAKKDVNAVLKMALPHLYPLRNPRSHKVESEVYKDGLPYVGGGGPIDPRKSVNNAWDAK